MDSGTYDHGWPIAIGGVGGSGTRLVAQILRALGLHIGTDLNEAHDNLWFTLLFKRIEILDCDDTEFDLAIEALVSSLQQGRPLRIDVEVLIRRLSRESRLQHDMDWLSQRAESLRQAAAKPPTSGRWGWKEPNTHIVIERLWQWLPALRYVHVVRHGVDMAYSSNQNQVSLWGAKVLGDGEHPYTPERSLAYWCRVHQRMQALLATNQQRMYWLDYDALCRDPAAVLKPLLEFLGYDEIDMAPLLPLVRPKSVRTLDARNHAFQATDLEFVRSLGYAV